MAKIISRSHSCVQKIIGRFKSDGLIENKSGRGRKSILSDVAKRKVLKDIKIDPKLSVVKLAAETSRIIGRCVSAETVRNVIRHAGYNSRVARKKPFISLQNQKERLEFAKTHQMKTDNFWKLYLVTKVNSTFLEVMAVAPFGESEHRFGSKKFTSYRLGLRIIFGGRGSLGVTVVSGVGALILLSGPAQAVSPPRAKSPTLRGTVKYISQKKKAYKKTVSWTFPHSLATETKKSSHQQYFGRVSRVAGTSSTASLGIVLGWQPKSEPCRNEKQRQSTPSKKKPGLRR
ncbi:HTH_Tnp_Tc3_2 domain-containing protein [Trichonephila clavipes]|nr:HTH_Tnp_Tc3_2 domain-containing protein [Trichonephila clavipes]